MLRKISGWHSSPKSSSIIKTSQLLVKNDGGEGAEARVQPLLHPPPHFGSGPVPSFPTLSPSLFFPPRVWAHSLPSPAASGLDPFPLSPLPQVQCHSPHPHALDLSSPCPPASLPIPTSLPPSQLLVGPGSGSGAPSPYLPLPAGFSRGPAAAAHSPLSFTQNFTAAPLPVPPLSAATLAQRPAFTHVLARAGAVPGDW